MDPVTLIVSAVALGAAAGAKDVVPQAIKDAYAGFKALVVRKLGGAANAANVEDAVKQVEDKPESEGRKAVLQEEIEAAKPAIDPELIAKAEALLKQLQEAGQAPAGVSYTATLTGSGAIAQGPGAIAGGPGSTIISGNSGNVNTGTHIDARGSQGLIKDAGGPINQHFGTSVDTGGAAYIGGNVSAGGDVVGRDKITHNYYGAGALNENVMAQWSPTAKNLYNLLKDKWFSESDLQDLAFQLDLDWDNLRGETKTEKARALVQACEQNSLIEKLRGLMRLARPNLRDQL
jgi:hypothetical protein